jgi:hypothetical protein
MQALAMQRDFDASTHPFLLCSPLLFSGGGGGSSSSSLFLHLPLALQLFLLYALHVRPFLRISINRKQRTRAGEHM